MVIRRDIKTLDRTFATFRWDLQLAADSEPPFAADDVQHLVEQFCAAGIDAKGPEDGQYAWDISCRLPHLWMDCQLGLLSQLHYLQKQEWLLACYPWRGLVNWLLWRRWENEQEHFVSIVDRVLRSDHRITNLKWHSRNEWNRPRRRTAL